ncbi:MAG: thioredoxin domain-containing protein [Rhodoferax sp.]|uniref:thioredoxin family protein n=1 Tax=Rhodoferax sp. TaxID=50421 RepID=UPI00263958C5|nr:thioredoxin domain-containing protein [Rhodoferax sp.]MDD2880211.1 thioredoxin domain-containing protein [Rhodoferax sp.]
MELVFDVEESDFEALVVARSHSVPVVLDIGADWCGPCRMLTPLLERLAVKYAGKFVLAKVDADENMRIAGRHQAKGFPTVIAYSHGQVVDRFHGMQTEGFSRHFLDKLIAHQATLSNASQPDDSGRV